MTLALSRHSVESTTLAGRLASIGAYVGNTPMRKLRHNRCDLYVKLEYMNYSGSIKDRAVYNILSGAIANGDIGVDTTIVESSSGNFAVALASMCRELNLRCIVVIDPNINSQYEKALWVLASEVIKVDQRDETGGFLLTRLARVQEIRHTRPDVFWTNQYGNPDNSAAYYNGLALEIGKMLPRLDYAFIGVSTCGTIAGISQRLKEMYAGVKVVAVDIQGSVVFGHSPEKRHISGLGSSMVPPLLSQASIDEVVMVEERNIVGGCYALLEDQAIFGGASAGAMYYAAARYFRVKQRGTRPTTVFLCPDRGTAYLDNIYNEGWVRANIDPAFRLAEV